MSPTSPDTATPTADALARADALVADGRALDAIDELVAVNRRRPDPEVEARLVQIRHLAHAQLPTTGRPRPTPATAADGTGSTATADADEPASPELDAADLTAAAVRARMLRFGHALVRGLFDQDRVAAFVDGIDRAIAARAAGPDSPEARATGWFRTLPLPREEIALLGRHWVGASGGVLALDSPTLLFRLLEAYEELGLRDVLTAYLGEVPVLGGNKVTMRRVPVEANTEWHQDGAFLGQGIRAVNVWVGLTDCGTDAPGIDLVARRFDQVVETGTGGALFDWAVGPETVARVAGDTPVTRPALQAGDALIFDELFLHRTGIDPSMTAPRYAIESWFFAPSCYPAGQVPLVW